MGKNLHIKLIISSFILISTLLVPCLTLNPEFGFKIQYIDDITSEFEAHVDGWQNNGVMIPKAMTNSYNIAPDLMTQQLCSDGKGGAYLLWINTTEIPPSTKFPLCVQHINSTGHFQWANPLTLFYYVLEEAEEYGPLVAHSRPKICADGTGGAIIVWSNFSKFNGRYYLHAQRITANGTKRWTAPYVMVVNNRAYSYGNTGPQIVSDGAGGVILVWDEYPFYVSTTDLFAQHLNSEGIAQWGTNGVLFCAETNNQQFIQVCSDSAGGVIVTWLDYRATNWDIYARHINSAGEPQGTSNGVAICTTLTIPTQFPQICPDGAGGAIITWYSEGNIYAQRFASETPQWASDGVVVCNAADIQKNPTICGDGAKGCYITWQDQRSWNYDIFAQRLNSTGGSRWTQNGNRICNAPSNQENPQICPDNTGGAVIAWQDYRSNSHHDIYAQRIDSMGEIQWILNGAAICNTTGNQTNPLLCNAGSGNVIIMWGEPDPAAMNQLERVYVQRVEIPLPSGIPGFEVELLFLVLSLFATTLFYVRKKSSIKLP